MKRFLREEVTSGVRGCSVCGAKISKGTKIIVVLSGSHRVTNRNVCEDCRGLTFKEILMKQTLDGA